MYTTELIVDFLALVDVTCIISKQSDFEDFLSEF